MSKGEGNRECREISPFKMAVRRSSLHKSNPFDDAVLALSPQTAGSKSPKAL